MAFIAMNPSAKSLIAVVSVVYGALLEAYVPTVTSDENCWKNASEIPVTSREP